VNGLLYRVARLDKLVREDEATLAHLWQTIEPGKQDDAVHVNLIIDVIQNVGVVGWCFDVLRWDLLELSDASGFVCWEQFKDLILSDVDTQVRSMVMNLVRNIDVVQ